MIGQVVEAIMVVLSLLGAVLVAARPKSVLGFKVWVASSVVGVVFGLHYCHWLFALLQLTYVFVDCYAIRTRKELK